MKSIEDFLEFHEANPEVYALFKRFASEALTKGAERLRYSVRTIGERVRWHTDVETVGSSFKINDHYLPYYSRLLMFEDKRFENFFERRTAVADNYLDQLRQLIERDDDGTKAIYGSGREARPRDRSQEVAARARGV